MDSTPAAPPVTPPRMPQGPKGLPVLGCALERFRDPLDFFLSVYRQYGDVAEYRLGPIRMIQLNHPDHVKHVLVDNAQNYVKSVGGRPAPLIGRGLFASAGKLWKRQRRMIQPAFSRETLLSYVPALVDGTRAMLTRWEARARAGERLDAVQEMTRLALTQVGRVVFTRDPGDDHAGLHETVEHILFTDDLRGRSLWQFLPVHLLRDWRYDASIRRLNEVMFGVIAERRRGGGPSSDMLGLMMAARDPDTNEGMTDQQLRDEAVGMYVAGHQATGTAMAWAWHLLAEHPALEQRMRDEVFAALGDREPTAEDLPKLRYVGMVYQEAMRLYPPAWSLGRLIRQPEVLGGWQIPSPAVINMLPYILHRHPSYWPEPERFDPERFDPERGAKHARQAFIPFGAGQRQCIGNQLAILQATISMAMVVQRYRLNVVPGHQVVPDAGAILKPRGGLPVTLSPVSREAGAAAGSKVAAT